MNKKGTVTFMKTGTKTIQKIILTQLKKKVCYSYTSQAKDEICSENFPAPRTQKILLKIYFFKILPAPIFTYGMKVMIL